MKADFLQVLNVIGHSKDGLISTFHNDITFLLELLMAVVLIPLPFVVSPLSKRKNAPNRISHDCTDRRIVQNNCGLRNRQNFYGASLDFETSPGFRKNGRDSCLLLLMIT